MHNNSSFLQYQFRFIPQEFTNGLKDVRTIRLPKNRVELVLICNCDRKYGFTRIGCNP